MSCTYYFNKIKDTLDDAINTASNNLESAGYTVVRTDYSLDMKCAITIRGNHKKDLERIAGDDTNINLYETHEDDTDPETCTVIWVKGATVIDELIEFTDKVRKATEYSAETGFTTAVKGVSNVLGISITVPSYTDTTIDISMRMPKDYIIHKNMRDRLCAMVRFRSDVKFVYSTGNNKYDFSFDNNCENKMKVIEWLANLPACEKDDND